MGNWHTPTQTALILKKIQLDIPVKILYEYEYTMGWTEASRIEHYWGSLKDRILKLTGNCVYSYLKPDTINYKKMIESKRNFDIKMSKKTQPLTKEERKKLYERLTRDELEIILEAMEDYMDENGMEKPDHEKIRNKCKLVSKISYFYKYNELKINKKLLCSIFNLSRRTYNHRIKYRSDHIPRKIRKDSIIHLPAFAAKVHTAFESSNSIYGHRRVHICMKNHGYSCCAKTINNAMNKYELYAAERKSKKKLYELKSTSVKKVYLLSENNLLNYKPNEIFSIDFSQIKTSTGVMWMHGARDVVTGKVAFLEISEDQTSETVLRHLKKLPATTKIINTDYGANYLSSNVQQYLLSKNIEHSLGRVGCSYDNRWIEDFWKRIKYEWFTQHPTKHLNNEYVEVLMNQYRYFFNDKRISTISNWTSPINYEISLLK